MCIRLQPTTLDPSPTCQHAERDPASREKSIIDKTFVRMVQPEQRIDCGSLLEALSERCREEEPCRGGRQRLTPSRRGAQGQPLLRLSTKAGGNHGAPSNSFIRCALNSNKDEVVRALFQKLTTIGTAANTRCYHVDVCVWGFGSFWLDRWRSVVRPGRQGFGSPPRTVERLPWSHFSGAADWGAQGQPTSSWE